MFTFIALCWCSDREDSLARYAGCLTARADDKSYFLTFVQMVISTNCYLLRVLELSEHCVQITRPGLVCESSAVDSKLLTVKVFANCELVASSWA